MITKQRVAEALGVIDAFRGFDRTTAELAHFLGIARTQDRDGAFTEEWEACQRAYFRANPPRD